MSPSHFLIGDDSLNDPTADGRLPDAAEKVFRTVGNAARQDLQHDHHGARIHELVQHAQQLTDAVIREVVEASPTARRPACCEGCAACCHLHIVVTSVEVLAIAAHMHDQMTSENLADVRERIDGHIEQTDGLDASARRQIRPACPLLESGRCAIYSVRPISCRGWNSLDRSVCDADIANPEANAKTPVNLGQYVLAGRVVEGLAAASHSMRLENRPLDFARGLRIALDDPAKTAMAWRAGTDVFAEAVNERVFPGSRDFDEERARTSLWNSL